MKKFDRMTLIFTLAVFGTLFVAGMAVAADDSTALQTINKVVEVFSLEASGPASAWLSKAAELALKICGSFAVIGFVLSIKDLIFGGGVTIEGVIGLSVRYILIIGLVVWLLGNTGYLYDIPKTFSEMGSYITGESARLGTLMARQRQIVAPIIEAQSTLSFTDIGSHIALYFVRICICVLFYMIAATVIVCQAEIMLTLIAGLFTISFLFIPFFKDLFLGYLKGLGIAGMKLTLISFLIGIIRAITNDWPAQITTAGGTTGMIDVGFAMVAGLVIMFMLLQMIPSIAAQIMTGQPSMLGGSAFTATAMAGAAHVMNVAHKASSGVNTTVDAARAFSSAKNATQTAGGTSGQGRGAGAMAALQVLSGFNGSGGAEAAARQIEHKHKAKTGGTGGGSSGSMSDPATRGEAKG